MYISEKIVPFSEVSRSTKNEEESRMIMMLGIHSKIVFSLFAASKLKKRIEKEELKNQYGPKPAGVEAVVHIF